MAREVLFRTVRATSRDIKFYTLHFCTTTSLCKIGIVLRLRLQNKLFVQCSDETARPENGIASERLCRHSVAASGLRFFAQIASLSTIRARLPRRHRAAGAAAATAAATARVYRKRPSRGCTAHRPRFGHHRARMGHGPAEWLLGPGIVHGAMRAGSAAGLVLPGRAPGPGSGSGSPWLW